MVNYDEKPILEMKDIVKQFSGVYALNGITFDLYKSGVHCIVGENGAGKSTLIKTLSGAYTPTGGSITVYGKTYKTLTPDLTVKLGINVVYQENDLAPGMNVAENIYIGNEIGNKFGILNFRKELENVNRQMKDLGISIDPLARIEDLSVSDQQFVKILKALSVNPRILVMDEPTSMFNVEDVSKVLTLVKRIADKGISIIYISHYLDEVRSIADRITVIRDGAVVNTYRNENHDIKLTVLTRDMVGRPVDTFYHKEKNPIGEVMLEVKNLQLKKDSPKINFTVRKGEILGFAGMVGAGRTEIIRALTGADPKYAGEVFINGKKVTIDNPGQSIMNGFAHITEDRQKLGLMLNNSVLDNTVIVGLGTKVPGRLINEKQEIKIAEPILDKLNIKMPGIKAEVKYLSGGNQQKVVLGKWLLVDEDIYIFDEPTRGIDVNAKAEFYEQMTKLTREGKCIIMISSDMKELISMSDRVLVIRNGAIDSELTGDQITEQEIIKRALGVSKDD